MASRKRKRRQRKKASATELALATALVNLIAALIGLLKDILNK